MTAPAGNTGGMTLTFAALTDRARRLATGGRRAVLGITGAPAAGKTTLAEHLVRALADELPPDVREELTRATARPLSPAGLAGLRLGLSLQ